MNLQPRAIIILSIDAFGGHVDGKTLLQKRLYFTEVLLGENLGLDFHAHYYGPYSALINSELSTLKLQGQIREEAAVYGFSQTSAFERCRYRYDLTDAGKSSVRWLRDHYPADAERLFDAAKEVASAGNLDYMELSFAAKAHWILRQSNKPLSAADISINAGRFGWKVQPDQSARGIEFLHKVGLVRPAETTPVA